MALPARSRGESLSYKSRSKLLFFSSDSAEVRMFICFDVKRDEFPHIYTGYRPTANSNVALSSDE